MVKSKKMFGVFLIITLITICLRTMLIINNTGVDGMYIHESSTMVNILKAITIISCLFFWVLPYLDKAPEENRTRNKDKLLGFSMMIFGGVMMFIGLVDFFNILQVVWSPNIREIISLISMTPNAVIKIILALSTFISGWMTSTISIKVLSGVPINNNYLVSIMFTVSLFIRGLLFFKCTSTIATISDNAYTILAISFGTLFLYSACRLLFNCEIKSGYRLAVSSGYLAIFFGLLNTVPNYVAFFMKKNLFFSVKDTNGISNIAVAFFAIIFLFIILFSDGEIKNMFVEKAKIENSKSNIE